jgi:hypothetical protein
MKTINNIQLTESTLKIIHEATHLERYIRDGQLAKLCTALSTIENEARSAGWTINEMVWPREANG